MILYLLSELKLTSFIHPPAYKFNKYAVNVQVIGVFSQSYFLKKPIFCPFMVFCGLIISIEEGADVLL